MKPSVGRIVHFVSYDGKCRAAIVTEVFSFRRVDLSVFLPDGVVSAQDECPLDEGNIHGTWHWPERVE